MSHINGVLAFTNKLREIGKPMQELHIINIILSSYQSPMPEQDRTGILFQLRKELLST